MRHSTRALPRPPQDRVRGPRGKLIAAGLAIALACTGSVLTGGAGGPEGAAAAPSPGIMPAAFQDGIACSVIYGLDQGTAQSTQHSIYSIDEATGQIVENNRVALPGLANGLALDGDRNTFWLASQSTNQTSVTIAGVNASTGAVQNFTTSLRATITGGLVMGAFNPATGIYYFGGFAGADLRIYGFDTRTQSFLSGALGTVPIGTGGNGDFAFDDAGRLYIATDARLDVLDAPVPASAATPTPVLSSTTIARATSIGQIGSMAFGKNGNVYIGGQQNGQRTIFEYDPSSGAQLSSKVLSPTNIIADYASCSSPNTIQLQKSIDGPRFASGDQFALAITGEGLNNGNTGVTRGTESGIQNQTTDESAGPVLGRAGKTYRITETPSGTTNAVNYESSWRCVDRRSGTAVASGTGTSGAVTIPGASAAGSDILCTFTNRALIPELEITKTSDATVNSRPGDTVTYTVTATNTSDTDYTTQNPAVVFDDLSGVLDDADYANDARASQPGELSYAQPLLSWTGALASGAAVSLSYTATLKAGGDGTVRNVAWVPTNPEITTPPDCADTDSTCAVVEFPLPKLTLTKTADRTELPAIGEKVTYTVTATNPGPGVFTAAKPATFADDLSDVVDDADLDTASVDASVGTATVTGTTLNWTGALGAGESVTVTYTATYTGAGDRNLRNLACVPVNDAAPGTDPCQVVNIPGSGLTQWKTVEASTEPAKVGTELRYTLHFRNAGTTAATADAVDILTHVLDDADVTTEPSSALLSAVRAGDRIAVTGSLAPGATATVTYTVTVKPDGQRGDNRAANFLVAPGTTPPTDPTCTPADPRFPECTTTPIAEVTYTKTVTASSDPVTTGTVLSYDITVRGTGTVASPVSREDILTDVLDDATVTGAPTSDTAGVEVSAITDERFTLSGSIEPGATAHVTYSVTVKPEAERGNNSAANFLVTPGGTPPTECVPGTAECTLTPLPNIGVVKSVTPASGTAVAAGDTLTYTLTFTNSGEAAGPVAFDDVIGDVLDDADLTGTPEASIADLSVSAVTDGRFAVSGTLDAGQSATVTYTVTVRDDTERGNNRLANFVVPTGETPGTDCEPGDALCTQNPVPLVTAWKSVDPASQTPVVAGQKLSYTLHFENTGAATGPVARVDDLSHVLDDAELTGEPVASDSSWTLTREGNRLIIDGELAPNQKATVTYTVTVRAADDRGDDVLANFLLRPGTPTPPTPTCEPADGERADCTVNPVGEIAATKSVDPKSGTEVNVGDTLTYTLAFRNTGAAPVALDYVDHLSGVLDDADLVGEPRATGGATVTGPVQGRLLIGGTVAPGATAEVTYAVRVSAERSGDGTVANFLTPEGQKPPATCVPENPLCTHNPVVPPAPPLVPGLPSTGVAGLDVMILITLLMGAAGAGLFVIGRRRRRDEEAVTELS